MSPEGIDSLDAKSLKWLVLSSLARIDELAAQNNALLAGIDELLARIARQAAEKPDDARDKLLVFMTRRDVEPTNNDLSGSSDPA